MTEREQANEDLRLNEGLYAAAKQLRDHESAKRAAYEIARLHGVLELIQRQEIEEKR